MEKGSAFLWGLPTPPTSNAAEQEGLLGPAWVTFPRKSEARREPRPGNDAVAGGAHGSGFPLLGTFILPRSMQWVPTVCQPLCSTLPELQSQAPQEGRALLFTEHQRCASGTLSPVIPTTCRFVDSER